MSDINLSYNGKSFEQRESDGYVNLGQLCATHGKKLNDWTRLKGSMAYLEALAETLTTDVAGKITPDKLMVSAVDTIGGNDGKWG